MRTISHITVMILLLSAVLSKQGAEAATYYVATTGNDTTGDGSIGDPWLTVPKGIRSLHAGDTLYIRGGTYTIGAVYGNTASDTYGCDPSCPTSWATATRIMNYPGESVTINSLGFNMDNSTSTGGIAYLIWQGDTRANFIHQQNGTGGGSSALRVNNDVHHVRMQTMTIRNYTSHGITGGNSTNCTLKPTNIEIIDNEIRNNGDGSSGVAHEHGIYPSCGTNWTISRNYVVGNFGFGIHVNSSISTATNNFTIERNLVEGRKGPTGSAAGIAVTAGAGHEIKNNVVIGQGSQPVKLTIGIEVAWRLTGATIVNNTVYNTLMGIQAINSTGITIKNNIMNAVTTNVDLNSSSVTVGNNLCTTNEPDGGCSVTTATPGFVTTGSNFRLAVGSPAINAGATISTVTNDYDGVARPAGVAYDIGAYEGSTGPDDQPPVSPVGLRIF